MARSTQPPPGPAGRPDVCVEVENIAWVVLGLGPGLGEHLDYLVGQVLVTGREMVLFGSVDPHWCSQQRRGHAYPSYPCHQRNEADQLRLSGHMAGRFTGP